MKNNLLEGVMKTITEKKQEVTDDSKEITLTKIPSINILGANTKVFLMVGRDVTPEQLDGAAS